MLGLGFQIFKLYRDNGKYNGNYYSILGLYRDNGKEHGNDYSLFRFYATPPSPHDIFKNQKHSQKTSGHGGGR